MKLSKSFKRIVSVVLAVMMLASVCAVAVSAATVKVSQDMNGAAFTTLVGATVEYVADPDDAANQVAKVTSTGGVHWYGTNAYLTLAGANGEAFVLEADTTYRLSFKYKYGAGSYLGASNKWNANDNIQVLFSTGEGNVSTPVAANDKLPDNADWKAEIAETQNVGPETQGWKEQYVLTADTAWYTLTGEYTTGSTLAGTDLKIRILSGGPAVTYIDDVVVEKVRTTDYGTTAPAILTLDFENKAGMAVTNASSEVREYVADPEDPDNTVFHVAFEQPAGANYAWQAGMMFGNTKDAVVDGDRSDGFTLVAGRTYTISFKYKIGAGTTFDRVTDGPAIEGFEDEFYFEDSKGNVIPKMDYRNYMRLVFVTDGFTLGGNQAFGNRINASIFPGNDSLQQTYWSEQLYDDWYEAMGYSDADDEFGWPFYIRQSVNDTPWIDYTYTFTATDAMNGTKLGLNIVPGNGALKDIDSNEQISANGLYFNYSYYIDDVVIEYEADGAKFGDNAVQFVDGKATVPADAEYYTDIDGNIYFPGDVVLASNGYYNFTKAVPTYAADRAFGVRIDGYSGIRARGALTAADIAAADEIGFAIVPKIAPDLTANWAEDSAYTYKVAVEKDKVYGAASAIEGSQYQVCLFNLEGVEDQEFMFALYVTIDGVTTYNYIGCQSFNTVNAALGQ